MRAIRRLTVRTVLPAPLAPLSELAMNLRWSWHRPTRELFESIDPDLWAGAGVESDPSRMLGAVTTDRLAELSEDAGFRTRLREQHDDLRTYLAAPRWYQNLDEPGPAAIAYFSPEYGVAAVLPQYSGGLGILAGDHLKTASDLGVPLIGVGLLYRSGYFRQSLSREGWQQETYPVIDPHGLPLSLLRDDAGAVVRVYLDLPRGRRLAAQIWRAEVGRVPLLLLDSDVEDNEQPEREVTDRLYGGGSEHRLQQELLLGVGGVRAVRAYCAVSGHAAPEVFHTNEGHAGFAGLERIRELIEAEGLSFEAALEAVRAGAVFTTHTPVAAGIDRFDRELIARYLGPEGPVPAVPTDSVLALGAETYVDGDPSVFNMAVMGLRLAQRANGVSRLHGAVSREMFNGLWPGFDADEVPISSITNGVHAPTWVAREIFDLARSGPGGEALDNGELWEALGRASDDELWQVRRELRARLVVQARRRVEQSWLQRGASSAELGWIENVLDPDVLTIGFARRVPSYKRLTLMLQDPERLTALLTHPERPIQIVVAGKSHPADESGKKLVRQLVAFADSYEVRHRVVFLPDYDMGMAADLMPGCDVWLNNPLRPLEASGTSGMKSALNGGLNLSVLDGWWDEMYDGHDGWAIPTAEPIADPDRRDALEAAALYELIEHSVVNPFYDRPDGGPPVRWVAMVRHTLRTLGPRVTSSRMMREYVTELYRPAAASALALDGAGHEPAAGLAAWKQRVHKEWGGVRVDHLETGGVSDTPVVGQSLQLSAFVALGALGPGDVVVQAVYGPAADDDRLVQPRTVALGPVGALDDGRWRFDGQIVLDRAGSFGYTVRVLPYHPLLAFAAEMSLVAWPDAPTRMVDGDLR
jgi:glycogen phosphorylase